MSRHFEIEDDSQIDRLNEEYFRQSPLPYLRQRLDSLVSLAARLPEHGERLTAGFNRAGLGISVPPDHVASTELAEDELRTFVATESAVVRQHAIESLLIGLHAERGRSRCPWLACASLTLKSLWQDTERLLTMDPSGRRTTIFQCLAGPIEGDYSEDEQARRHSFASALDAWLVHLATEVLDSRDLYNAAKHGLAVRAANMDLNVGMTQDQATLNVLSGPTLEHLVHTRHDDLRAWHRRRRWVDVEVMWVDAMVAATLLQTTWEVGRRRLLGGQLDGVWLPTEPPDVRRTDGSRPLNTGVMTLPLGIVQTSRPDGS